MNNWQKFEIECTNYLNDTFSDYADFYHEGGADSTIPDIRVETNTNQIFYIDAKKCPAQCGQFVLLPDISTRTFKYSSQNANEINNSAIEIINFMNDYFDEYKEAGTAGKEINIKNSSQIFVDWITQTYREKGVHLFITNDYKIVEIDDFSEYFNITATYRIKRSGSGSVGKKRLSVISKYVKEHYAGISSVTAKESKLFVTSTVDLHNQRFVYGGYEYMISNRGLDYEIRRLSNTFNANVIFSIKLKSNKSGLTNNEFIEFLK